MPHFISPEVHPLKKNFFKKIYIFIFIAEGYEIKNYSKTLEICPPPREYWVTLFFIWIQSQYRNKIVFCKK